MLIEKGIHINKQNKEGNTALHLAYINNDDSIINLLIEKSIYKQIVNKANKMAEELRVRNRKINSNLNTNNQIKACTKINIIFLLFSGVILLWILSASLKASFVDKNLSKTLSL